MRDDVNGPPAALDQQEDLGPGSPESHGTNIRWRRVALLGAALLLIFLLGRASAPDGVPQTRLEATRAAITHGERQIAALELALREREAAEAETVTPTPSDTGSGQGLVESDGARTYTVREGDTMRGIAQTFCGDPDLAEFVAV